MAGRRCISTTSTLVTKRFHPSFNHILHKDSDDTRPYSPVSSPHKTYISNFLPIGSHNLTTGLGSMFRGGTYSAFIRPMGLGYSSCRSMSSTIEDGSSKFDDIGYVAEVIADKTVESVASQAPTVSEVAIAAADSPLPVAALQYVIDGVHSFTGLNWWASIALTTLMIRGATIPLLINQLKSTAKLNLLRPRLEELKQKLDDSAMDPKAAVEHQQRVMALFKEHGVNPFTPLKGLLIQGPIFISFFLAVRNMAEKVPSFHNGGALWFIDLTTPDSYFILPILTSLTFWITVECNMQEGLEGNPIAGTMKYFSRILAVVAVPVMMSFPKALFCYWFTSNLFSLTYGLVLKHPNVKKFLNLPEAPTPSETAQPPVSLFSAFKQPETVEPDTSLPTEQFTGGKISRSSVITQRLRSLEKHVKGRKKNKN